MTRKFCRPLSVAIAAAALLVFSQASTAQVTLPVKLRTFAVNTSNNLSGANAVLEITINQWSSAAERMRLIDIASLGQDDLLKELKKAPIKGRIRIPAWQGPDPGNYRLGWDLRYAWHEALPEGGERIVVATDRFMTMWEAVNNPRSADYPFTILQMQLGKDMKGDGRMTAFTMVKFDKKKNVIEF